MLTCKTSAWPCHILGNGSLFFHISLANPYTIHIIQKLLSLKSPPFPCKPLTFIVYPWVSRFYFSFFFLSFFSFSFPLPHLLHFPLQLIPPNLAKLAQRLELAVAELDVGGPDDAHVEGERLADLLVGLDAAVVAHDEVVALCVALLAAGDGLGEGEGAPVTDVADDTPLLEDDLAGREDQLFYFGEVPGADLEKQEGAFC